MACLKVGGQNSPRKVLFAGAGSRKGGRGWAKTTFIVLETTIIGTISFLTHVGCFESIFVTVLIVLGGLGVS